jgi:hypothetical protein
MAFRISKDCVKQHSLTWDRDTWQHAKAMSARKGISVSALTRILINKEWQAVQQEKEAA